LGTAKRGEHIVRVEWGLLEGTRPRTLGKNARLRAHGSALRVPLCRITTSEGARGVGLSRIGEELAGQALGQPVSAMFSPEAGTSDAWSGLDYPLWDLAGVRAGQPVYRLGPPAGPTAPSPPATVACYDTSLYFDDLGIEDDDPQPGAEVVAAEAASGYERGHRAFKVKVGRGGRWMSPAAGLERDVAVTLGVREAIGPRCALFADANNGYTLNGARAFLEKTAGAAVGWLEEPFHEDAVLLEALREWVARSGLHVLVADGESASADAAYELAARGLLDVVQCDILATSFSGWRRLGPSLDAIGVGSAPHHFGLYLGNYVSGHLCGAVRDLRYVEWDESTVPGLEATGYRFSEGFLALSPEPGFGIEVDDGRYRRAVESTGFDVQVTGVSR
jgi:L-rhamnonate dehydratase